MRMTTTLVAAAAAALFCTGASAQTTKVPPYLAFDGAIGVTPWAVASGAPVLNDVNTIAPGGRPWVMKKLTATIGADASIRIKGRGLLLAGGAGVGTRATIANVGLSLFCSGAIVANSEGIPLDTAGNFSFTGFLKSPVSTANAVLPGTCATPILLVRSFTPSATALNGGTLGGWFAAGIVSTGDDD